MFRTNQLEAVLEAVTAAGNTTLSIGVEHRMAIERLHSSTVAAPVVIPRLIVRQASAQQGNRAQAGNRPSDGAIAWAATKCQQSRQWRRQAAIVSGVEVDHRVPAIALAAEQERGWKSKRITERFAEFSLERRRWRRRRKLWWGIQRYEWQLGTCQQFARRFQYGWWRRRWRWWRRWTAEVDEL